MCENCKYAEHTKVEQRTSSFPYKTEMVDAVHCKKLGFSIVLGQVANCKYFERRSKCTQT